MALILWFFRQDLARSSAQECRSESERSRNDILAVGTKSERHSCEVGTTHPTEDHRDFSWFPDLLSSSGLEFI